MPNGSLGNAHVQAGNSTITTAASLRTSEGLNSDKPAPQFGPGQSDAFYSNLMIFAA